MLTFEEKLAIIESFPQLTRRNVSLGRVNFQYEESKTDKKNVVFHLHPNGNGYVYAGNIQGYTTDEKGMVNIRNFTEAELRKIIEQSIHSLDKEPTMQEELVTDFTEETWRNRDKQSLVLTHEDDMWNVYAGLNLDGTFNSYGEAAAYLEEEGFKRI